MALSTASTGRDGEDLAARLLARSGLKIVERNYRCRVGEIDIVARDRATLVFVEVRRRTRTDRGSALETVDLAKQRKVARVAQCYLLERRPKQQSFRFDVVGITGDDVVHVRDAYRL